MNQHKKTFLYFVLGTFAPLVLFESEAYREIMIWRQYRLWKRAKRSGELRARGHYDAFDSEHRTWIVDASLLGRRVHGNVGFFRQTARNYKRHRNPEVARLASKLYRDSDKALFLLNYLRAGLELRLQLWRFWHCDNSDLREFWKSHFESTYNGLEERIRKLASLVLDQEGCEAADKILSAQRLPLELSKTKEDEVRDELRELKGTLWHMVAIHQGRLKHPFFKSIVGWGSQDGMSPHGPFIRAYAHGIVNLLPEAEGDLEMKEIDKLLDQLGC